MKRKLAAILTVIAVVFTLASCGNTEENLLPFGLQFGCSEADFLKRLEKFGYEVEIEQSNTNNGFVVNPKVSSTFKECAELLPFGEIFDTEEREEVSVPEIDPEESYTKEELLENFDLVTKNLEISTRNLILNWDSYFYYSLNQNKLLYEFGWFFEDTADGEFVGELVNYFNAYFGFNTDTFEEGDSVAARWYTEELAVEILTPTYLEDDGQYCLIYHSFEYDDVIRHGTGIGE